MDMLVLRTLLPGPAHGHAIAHAIERNSDDVLQVEQGSLYPALHRLERLGLAESTAERVDGRVRRIYSLTGDGRSARAEARASWMRYAQAVQSVLGPVSPLTAGGAA